MAMAIAQKLSLAGEVILLDKSPMFIRRLQIDNKSDYLKDGQVLSQADTDYCDIKQSRTA